MEHNVRVRVAGGLAFAAITIGLSVFLSAYVASRAYEQRGQQAASQNQELAVRGTARQRVSADLGTWSIAVRAQGESLPEAYTRVEAGIERVRAFLKDAGFGEGAVVLGPIDTATQFERDARGVPTNKILGYTLSRTFTVSTPDVQRIAKASGEVTQLIKEGVEVASSSPQFFVSKLPDMRISMMGLAAQDARARADEIASKAGCRIAEVRRVNAGPFQVTTPNSTDVSGGGSYDTSTIEKDVSITVNVTFGVRS